MSISSFTRGLSWAAPGRTPSMATGLLRDKDSGESLQTWEAIQPVIGSEQWQTKRSAPPWPASTGLVRRSLEVLNIGKVTTSSTPDERLMTSDETPASQTQALRWQSRRNKSTSSLQRLMSGFQRAKHPDAGSLLDVPSPHQEQLEASPTSALSEPGLLKKEDIKLHLPLGTCSFGDDYDLWLVASTQLVDTVLASEPNNAVSAFVRQGPAQSRSRRGELGPIGVSSLQPRKASITKFFGGVIGETDRTHLRTSFTEEEVRGGVCEGVPSTSSTSSTSCKGDAPMLVDTPRSPRANVLQARNGETPEAVSLEALQSEHSPIENWDFERVISDEDVEQPYTWEQLRSGDTTLSQDFDESDSQRSLENEVQPEPSARNTLSLRASIDEIRRRTFASTIAEVEEGEE